jgi:hypothetical protein
MHLGNGKKLVRLRQQATLEIHQLAAWYAHERRLRQRMTLLALISLTLAALSTTLRLLDAGAPGDRPVAAGTRHMVPDRPEVPK